MSSCQPLGHVTHDDDGWRYKTERQIKIVLCYFERIKDDFSPSWNGVKMDEHPIF